MKYRIYHFKVTLAGTGRTPNEAWNDAIEALSLENGLCPDEDSYTIVDEGGRLR